MNTETILHVLCQAVAIGLLVMGTVITQSYYWWIALPIGILGGNIIGMIIIKSKVSWK